MKGTQYSLLVLALLFGLILGATASCGGGGNSGGSHHPAADDDAADDDAADDDDNDDDDSTDDDAADDDTSSDDDTGSSLFDITFDDYALGDLPSPWVVAVAGATTFQVIADPTKKAAQVLQVTGDVSESGSATYPFDSSADVVAIVVHLYTTSGSSFGLVVNYPDGWVLEILRDPTTGNVIEYPDSNVCAETLADNTWHILEVDLQLDAGTFNFFIDTSATDCMDMALQGTTPLSLVGFTLMDWGNAGFGGIVYYDNIRGTEIPIDYPTYF